MLKRVAALLIVAMLLAFFIWESQREEPAANLAGSILIGDSVSYGFIHNEMLPEERFIGGAGTTAGLAYDDIAALKGKLVDSFFIMLGSNDLYMPVADPAALYRQDMASLIAKIKLSFPTSKIYLQSVLPVTAEALAAEPRYAAIGAYNTILKKLAQELEVEYVDVGVLADENPSLYAEDGIHFKREFYRLWLEKLSALP